MSLNAIADPSAAPTAARPVRTRAFVWTRLMEMRIGIIPLPIYVLLLALIAAFAVKGKISGEVTVMIGVIVAGGFTCAEIGRRIPFLRAIGGSSLVTSRRTAGLNTFA